MFYVIIKLSHTEAPCKIQKNEYKYWNVNEYWWCESAFWNYSQDEAFLLFQWWGYDDDGVSYDFWSPMLTINELLKKCNLGFFCDSYFYLS